MQLAEYDPWIDAFLKDKHLENLNWAHLTLAHKRSHGIKAVADYGLFLPKMVPVELTVLLFSDKMAAFEAFPRINISGTMEFYLVLFTAHLSENITNWKKKDQYALLMLWVDLNVIIHHIKYILTYKRLSIIGYHFFI